MEILQIREAKASFSALVAAAEKGRPPLVDAGIDLRLQHVGSEVGRTPAISDQAAGCGDLACV